MIDVPLHSPILADVHFEITGERIIVAFDRQATNRASMNGLSDCASILDNTTVAMVRGNVSTATFQDCDWEDDSTLIVFLSEATEAAPGMVVGIQPNVLWPRAFVGSCTGEESLCASKQAMHISQEYPCDKRSTDDREYCVQPTGLIQGPEEIGGCPGTEVLLDASRATGGGARALTFRWRAVPRTCDNYNAIKARFAFAGNLPRVRLRAKELDDGLRFDIVLITTNYLGIESAPFYFTVRRVPLPIPSLVIHAPPLLLIAADQVVSLEAGGLLSPCNATQDLSYEWVVANSTWAGTSDINTTLGMPTPPQLSLDVTSSSLRILRINGSKLLYGARYILRATACVGSACTAGTVSVARREEVPPPPPFSLERVDGVLTKQNPSERLLLETSELIKNLQRDNPEVTFKWSADPPHLDLDSPNATTTGDKKPNLALRPNVLLPGAQYIFRLRAIDSSSSYTTIAAAYAVSMNRAPIGGILQLTHTAPAIAMTTLVSIDSRGWIDDPSDYPLTYRFSIRPRGVPFEPAMEIALSSRSMRSLIEWLPIEGDWYVVCQVYDGYDAASIVEQPISVLPVKLKKSISTSVLDRVRVLKKESDLPSMLRMAGSFSTLLNSYVADPPATLEPVRPIARTDFSGRIASYSLHAHVQ